MTSKYLKIALAVLFAAATIGLFVFFDAEKLISVDKIQNTVDSYGALAPLAFIFFYALITIFFLPAAPLSIAAGALFGTLLGTIYTVIGASIGAIAAFFFARFLGQDFVERFLKNWFKKIFAYNEKLAQNGFQVVLFLRLVPLFPFNGLNFALGLTRVSFRDYALATAIGIIPGAFAFVYFGSSLASLDPLQIAIATIVLFGLIFAPTFYKKHQAKRGKNVDAAIGGADNDGTGAYEDTN